MPQAPGTLGKAVVAPFIALKAFRSHSGSGNLLFGGRKTGQEEADYFAHCVCSHFTERCSFAMWPVLRRFRAFSDFPTQTGLSDFASVTQDGVHETPSFPWALVLKPIDRPGRPVTGNFLEQLDGVETGTALFRILACGSPQDATKGTLQEIGTLFTASKFIQSALEDRLRFKHQLMEEDYKLRPEWKKELRPEHKNYGWEYFGQFQPAARREPLPYIGWTWPGGDTGPCAGGDHRIGADGLSEKARFIQDQEDSTGELTHGVDTDSKQAANFCPSPDEEDPGGELLEDAGMDSKDAPVSFVVASPLAQSSDLERLAGRSSSAIPCWPCWPGSKVAPTRLQSMEEFVTLPSPQSSSSQQPYALAEGLPHAEATKGVPREVRPLAASPSPVCGDSDKVEKVIISNEAHEDSEPEHISSLLSFLHIPS